MNALSEYETDQVNAIKAWQTEKPSIANKLFDTLPAPVGRAAPKMISADAIKKALGMLDKAADWLADKEDIAKQAGVSKIEALHDKELESLDTLADHVHNWAIGIASAEGVATGVSGFLALAADTPAVVVLALRTIYKIGLCYGYELQSETDKKFVLAILAAAGANSKADKSLALQLMRNAEVTAKLRPSPKMAAAGSEAVEAKDSIVAVEHVARAIERNLAKRQALQTVPAVGAIVGGSLNAWYLKDVGWAARRAFQERWLIDHGKLSA